MGVARGGKGEVLEDRFIAEATISKSERRKGCTCRCNFATNGFQVECRSTYDLRKGIQ